MGHVLPPVRDASASGILRFPVLLASNPDQHSTTGQKSGFTPCCLEWPGGALLRATLGRLMDSQCCEYPMVVIPLSALEPTYQGELQTQCSEVSELGWTLTTQLMAYFCTRELLVA